MCKGSLRELDDTFIADKRNRSATARQCLAKALEGTRWTVGHVDDTGAADLSFYHVSVLEAVHAIVGKYGLEITTSLLMDADYTRITDRAVNLVTIQGDQNNPRRFEYGHDLKGITRTIDASSVKTRLYGYGKGLPTLDENGEETGGYGRRIDFSDVNNGKPYIEDTEATQRWGLPGPAVESLRSLLRIRIREAQHAHMAVLADRRVPWRRDRLRQYGETPQWFEDAAHGRGHDHLRHIGRVRRS